ncbi:TetR/AcrR family transcriptional regulator [Dyadobacter sp. CY323]|uniref:TetR/AcrR family transcriptional regulator n=1 Tax=Dyadobacter sp. CY323 TaxID=2907302 RepID=UPI001F3F5181|nr:TetR/AcrR family transcriptional regulator [Dyadobacter sp. CY323]MCE6987589.1 TetR/AcrR family transcriptional regulator [Dyadobacter sp. CY323]
MNATEEKIIKRALEIFNLKGIEYAGMRELAADLGMRIGNLTYYFPTKDDLVFRLSETYSESNSQIHQDFPVKSLYDFLKMSRLLFENGLRYQCLHLSMVHLMEQNPKMSEKYEGVRNERHAGLHRDMKILAENKYLKFSSDDDELLIISSNSIQNRFWLSEAVLSEKRQNLGSQMNYYLKMKAHLFRPYATKKGLSDIELFLGEIG